MSLSFLTDGSNTSRNLPYRLLTYKNTSLNLFVIYIRKSLIYVFNVYIFSLDCLPVSDIFHLIMNVSSCAVSSFTTSDRSSNCLLSGCFYFEPLLLVHHRLRKKTMFPPPSLKHAARHHPQYCSSSSNRRCPADCCRCSAPPRRHQSHCSSSSSCPVRRRSHLDRSAATDLVRSCSVFR